MVNKKWFQTLLIVFLVIFALIAFYFFEINSAGELDKTILSLSNVLNFDSLEEFDGSFLSLLIRLAFWFVFSISSLLIATVLHEFGHLIAGLISGYKLLYFRLGSYCLVKYEDIGYKIRRQFMPGTLGQCLMRPPTREDGSYPYFLYNFGGLLMNLILAFISLMIIKVSNIPVLNYFLMVLILINMGLFVSNFLPIIGVDGYNILEISRSEKYRKAFGEVLEIEYLRINDKPGYEEKLYSLKDLEVGIFSQYIDLCSMDKELYESNYEEFNKYYEQFNSREGLHPFYRALAETNKAYIAIIENQDGSLLDKLLKNKELKSVIKGLKNSLQRKRFNLVHQALIEKNNEKLARAKKEFKDALNVELDRYLLRMELAEVEKFVDMG